jgi:hypothetical protein
MPTVFAHPIEILALSKGRCNVPGPGTVLGQPLFLFTFRPDPVECLDPATILMTQEQCVRMRNTLNAFLNDSESWLFMTPEGQRQLAAEDS